MSDSKKNFNLSTPLDNVELLSLLLEKANQKGTYTLEESSWVYNCLNNLRAFVKTKSLETTQIASAFNTKSIDDITNV